MGITKDGENPSSARKKAVNNATQMNTLQTGDIVDDRYEIIEAIGQGGMGTVYKAREPGLDRLIALKLLQPLLLGADEIRQRFQREGKILSSVSHRNLPVFYRFGLWQQNEPYIAMEFLTGATLRKTLDDSGALPVARVLSIGAQICDGMHSAHKVNIVHRDLKPANIMLIDGRASGAASELALHSHSAGHDPDATHSEVDEVRILDFGLGRLTSVEASSNFNQRLTQTGEVIGTTYYMSPEQCMGRTADQRADIYALGCILYEMLTGSAPFTADNPIALMHQHVSQAPLAVHTKSKEPLPAGLANIIHRALAKDPDWRYQSMESMGHDLNLVRLNNGDEIPAPHTILRQHPRYRKRSSSLFAGVSVSVAIAFILVGRNNTFEPSTPSVPRVSRGVLQAAPSAVLVRALTMSDGRRCSVPLSPQVFAKAEQMAAYSIKQIPKSDRFLQFQGHLSLAALYDRHFFYLHNHKRDPKLDGELWALSKAEILTALRYMTKPDGSYYRPAFVAFDKLGALAEVHLDFASEKHYYQRALHIAQQDRNEPTSLNRNLIGADSGDDMTAWIKRQLAQCARKENDFTTATTLLRESYQTALSNNDTLTSDALDAALELASLFEQLGDLKKIENLQDKVALELRKEQREKILNTRDQASALTYLSRIALHRADGAAAMVYAREAIGLLDAASEGDLFIRCDQLLHALEKFAKKTKQDNTTAPLIEVANLRTRFSHLHDIFAKFATNGKL